MAELVTTFNYDSWITDLFLYLELFAIRWRTLGINHFRVQKPTEAVSKRQGRRILILLRNANRNCLDRKQLFWLKLRPQALGSHRFHQRHTPHDIHHSFHVVRQNM